MELTLHIPDDVAERLAASGSDLSRRALEAFSLEEYRAGRLTEPQLRQILGFETRDALDGFLKSHQVWLNFTSEDLDRERAALRRLGFGAWMRVVVVDTTPIHYLILVDAIDLLARLFEKIHIPVEVRDGLMREAAPKSVRTWIASPPPWVQIHTGRVRPRKPSPCFV
jgi:hypothetical protein